MRRNLSIDELDDLVERPLVATLATYRADGTVMLSSVWHEWRDGGFNVSTGTARRAGCSRASGSTSGSSTARGSRGGSSSVVAGTSRPRRRVLRPVSQAGASRWVSSVIPILGCLGRSEARLDCTPSGA